MLDGPIVNLLAGFVYVMGDDVYWLAPVTDDQNYRIWIMREGLAVPLWKQRSAQIKIWAEGDGEAETTSRLPEWVKPRCGYLEIEPANNIDRFDYYLYRLVIVPEHQGKGLGSAILRHLTWCADLTHSWLKVDPGGPSGAKANLTLKHLIAWYGRHGFRPYRKNTESLIRYPRRSSLKSLLYKWDMDQLREDILNE